MHHPFHIQLFRERLSEKVHAKIPKGIVGVFLKIHCPLKKFERIGKAFNYNKKEFIRLVGGI